MCPGIFPNLMGVMLLVGINNNGYDRGTKGFEKTYELLSKSYNIKLANVNEISKVDAGLSCMSLRW